MTNIVEARWGKFMIFPNDNLGMKLANFKDYEPHFYELTKNIIKPGQVCVDCGANLGYHTVCMAKQVGPSGRVYSFEPLRVIYQQLNGNVFLNDLRNVFCINAALGNARKTIQMDGVNFDAAGVNIGGTKVGGGGDTAEMVKLDDIIGENVNFMKLDVQGSEVLLLEGAQQLIQRSRPVMFIEVEENYLRCFGFTSEILLNKLLSMDYVLGRVENECPDHIAVPRERIGEMAGMIKDLSYPISIIDGKSVKLHFDPRAPHSNVLYSSFEVTK